MRSITLSGPSGRVELVRRDGGPTAGFDVVAPYHDRADREAVDELLTALSDLEVDTFHDDVDETELADLGLSPPRGVVAMRTVPELGHDLAADAPDARLRRGRRLRRRGGLQRTAGPPPPSADEAGGAASFRFEVGAPAADGLVNLRADGQVVTARSLLPEAVERLPGQWASRELAEIRPFEVVGVVATPAAGGGAAGGEGQ